jgi:hypothetical protein
MFEITIIAFVLIGLAVLVAYAASKPSLKEIKEASKNESHTSDLPFNEDFPVVENLPTMKPKKSSNSSKSKKLSIK